MSEAKRQKRIIPTPSIAKKPTKQIRLMDSISYISEEDAGHIIISGSHGGTAAGRYALDHPPYLVVFNDAGVGKEDAGIAALHELQAAGIPAVAVAHTSARIGEADDTWENGRVAHLNQLAKALGIREGMRVKTAVFTLLNT